MPKYKKYFQRMLELEKDLFEKFSDIHDKYENDQDTHQHEFNEIGKKVMEVVREHESKLCHQSEGGKYAKFAGNLAEKFQEELRKHYPMVDWIGVKAKSDPAFAVRKIELY